MIYGGEFQHTAARRRLGIIANRTLLFINVSTHSRPKAAGNESNANLIKTRVSTHSRPKAAGAQFPIEANLNVVSTHSRPKAAGKVCHRHLDGLKVSTHSRPKAAGFAKGFYLRDTPCFNTQPPEGGWSLSQKPCSIRFRSPDFAKLSRKARTRV